MEAMKCFEHFYALTNGRLWQIEDTGRTHFSMACESLRNVYTTLAKQVCIKNEFLNHHIS